jgi:hypothetical protein
VLALRIIPGHLKSVTHRIIDGGAGIIASKEVDDTSAPKYYNETISSGTIYEHCYQATLDAEGIRGTSNGWASATLCAPPAPSEPDDEFVDRPVVVD